MALKKIDASLSQKMNCRFAQFFGPFSGIKVDKHVGCSLLMPPSLNPQSLFSSVFKSGVRSKKFHIITQIFMGVHDLYSL